MDYDKVVYGEGMSVHKWSNREVEFYHFAMVVQGHIDRYTIPQYGDYPNDPVEDWTAEECLLAIQKYAKRHKVEQRGRIETLRDIAKIAHFACLTFDKMCPTKEEIRKVRRGEV